MNAATEKRKVLDREFLEIRHTIVTLAAALDRLQRAGECSAEDPRWQRLQEGLSLLVADTDARAEQVQLVFSRAYDPEWRRRFGL